MTLVKQVAPGGTRIRIQGVIPEHMLLGIHPFFLQHNSRFTLDLYSMFCSAVEQSNEWIQSTNTSHLTLPDPNKPESSCPVISLVRDKISCAKVTASPPISVP